MDSVLSLPAFVVPVHEVSITVTDKSAYITKIGWPYQVVASYPTVKQCIEHIERNGYRCNSVYTD